jgi:hypothetical protein
MHYLCQHLIPKMLTHEHKETRVTHERTMIYERQGSECKVNESTDVDVEYWLPVMLQKAL